MTVEIAPLRRSKEAYPILRREIGVFEKSPDWRFIVVDQFRGDLRYPLEKGTYFNNAHYRPANTKTIVGHTTLATGAFPFRHGTGANAWFDRQGGQMAYNVGDERFPVPATEDEKQESVQIDPAQSASKASCTGLSPKAILLLMDELAVSNSDRSCTFAVSVKDRGAISPAGHAGRAFR